MRYLIALVFPPLALLLCGKPVQFVLNLLLTLCFWFPGAFHAILVVHSCEAERRNRKLIRAVERGSKRITARL